MSDELKALKRKLYSIIICPNCKRSLQYKSASKVLRCPNCQTQYRNVKTVPVLFNKISRKNLQKYLNSVEGRQMVEEYANKDKSFFQKLKEAIKIPSLYYVFIDRQKYYQALAGSNPERLIVAIGGGPTRVGNFLNLNIDAYAHVDLVADAHNIPLKSASIDGIFIDSVLEHVENPSLVIDEAYRILKKGGLIYAETPFLQHYHSYPSHFQNFTLTGHDLLFKKFKRLESGPVVGPFSTVSVMILNLFEDFNDNKYIRKILMFIVAILLYPLRSLDFFMPKNKNNFKLTSIVYYLGKK